MTERMILAMIAGIVLIGCVVSMSKCSTEYNKNTWKETCIKAGNEIIEGNSCKKK